jgi:LmbE family N-acetylglucosaminyl deacetylase
MIRSTTATIITFFLFSYHLFAQSTKTWNVAEIKLQLQKLGNLGSVLYVAAHPDDENTRLLGFLAQELKYRTGYLSLTRGDGGQNLIGDEQASLLGMIRTQELLAARRIDGAEQFFSRANDFGFSKNAAETFEIWNKEDVLADAVWVIRNFQPDVIITRFPPDSRGGHGHHTASAMLAIEAFKAAADPKRFPEQLKYVSTWQAKRLLWNTFNFGNNNTITSDQFRIPVGAYNPLLGRSFGEIAAESRSQHKSQGFGVASSRGASFEHFELLDGSAPKETLMDGVTISWDRLKGGGAIEKELQQIIASYQLDRPDLSVPSLVSLRKKIKALPAGVWQSQKLKELDLILVAATGLWMEAFTKQGEVVLGESLQTELQLINRSPVSVQVEKITILGKEVPFREQLPNNQVQSIPFTIEVPHQLPISQPYWLQEKGSMGNYKVSEQQQIGNPWNLPAIEARIQIQIAGESIVVHRPLTYKYTDPVKGEIFNELIIVPPVVQALDQEVYLFTGNKPQNVQVTVRSMYSNQNGTVSLDLPAHFDVQPKQQAFALVRKGDEQVFQFTVKPSKTNTQNEVHTLRAISTLNGKTYAQSFKQIKYDHIPLLTIFPEAAVPLVEMDLKLDIRKIGYIPGAGDKVPQALRQIGLQVQLLDENEIMNGDLSSYDAIITGVRAYNTQERLRYWQPKLLTYVENGGTLLIQYNTNGNLVTNQIGPLELSLSRDRVTQEHAPVKILLPKDPSLLYPNVLTAADFEGWIQERGLYFPGKLDSRYKKLFSMADAGESDLENAVVIYKHGKGKYVYTGLSFFRQLPAGVPGAYRLLVNLLSNHE